MLVGAAAEKHGAFAIMDVCAIDARDVTWLLSQLSQNLEEAPRRIVAELVASCLDPKDVAVFDAVLVAATDDGDLRAAIGPRLEPVLLGSQYAEEMKAHHELLESHRQPKSVACAAPSSQSLSDILAADDPERFFRIYRLLHDQKGEPENRAEPLPGWSQFDETAKVQIRDAATDYVGTRPFTPPGEWWKEGKFMWGMDAGYSALHFLALQAPDSLDRLTDSDWEFWTRIVIAYLPSGTEASSRPLLVAKAYERAKGTFLSTLNDMIDSEDRRNGEVHVLSQFGDFWSDELATMLRTKITGGMLKPGSFRGLLAKLLTMGDVEAESVARAIAIGPVPGDVDGHQRAVFSIAELLSHRPREWSDMWPIIQANEALGVGVLQLIASEHEFNSFATAIDEADIADICIWLSKLGREKEPRERDEPGRVTPGVALAHWWNSLINFLTYKGTPQACNAIRRLIKALPQYEGLQSSLREAVERTRRATWIPPSPEEVIGLVSDSEARLIRNGMELVEVLIESLNRLESSLQGVTPSVEELWNELPTARDEPRIFRPKSEPNFSGYVKRHLDRELRRKGVILNREVEIRPPMGGKDGEDTDIFVDLIVPRGRSEELERISAVIEAKGCWNPDLNEAMKNQLVERYMTDSGIHYGIYLVGWFMCLQWDKTDYRRGRTPKISIADARRQFEEQALALSNEGRVIRSVVLNAALR